MFRELVLRIRPTPCVGGRGDDGIPEPCLERRRAARHDPPRDHHRRLAIASRPNGNLARGSHSRRPQHLEDSTGGSGSRQGDERIPAPTQPQGYERYWFVLYDFCVLQSPIIFPKELLPPRSSSISLFKASCRRSGNFQLMGGLRENFELGSKTGAASRLFSRSGFRPKLARPLVARLAIERTARRSFSELRAQSGDEERAGRAAERLIASPLTIPLSPRSGARGKFWRCGFRPQCAPAAVSCIIANAWSRVKVFGFWMGGNSLKVAAHCAASACAP